MPAELPPSLSRWRQSYGPHVAAAGDPLSDTLDRAEQQARTGIEVAVLVGVPVLVFATGVAAAGYVLLQRR